MMMVYGWTTHYITGMWNAVVQPVSANYRFKGRWTTEKLLTNEKQGKVSRPVVIS